MLMAGIGTGGFSVGSRGQIRKILKFSTIPDRGNNFPYTFFAVRAENADGEFACACSNRA